MVMTRLLFITALLFIASRPAKAGVNIKNGNFYMFYTDHAARNSKGVEIMRTYNSKAVEIGLFGFGWGSFLDTHLYLLGDGQLIVKEYGSGAQLYYTSPSAGEKELNACIQQLVDAAVEYGDIEDDLTEIRAFRNLMRSSVSDRVNKWLRYLQNGLIKPMSVPKEGSWESYDGGQYQKVEIDSRGFRRTNEDGTYEIFNAAGFLLGYYRKDATPDYELTYLSGNILHQVSDRGGNLFTFSINEGGHISSIRSRSGLSTYQYNGHSLIRSVDAGRNDYRFAYDSVHNMISIGYSDGTNMRIEYDPVTYFCTRVTDRQGVSTQYVYKNFYDEDGSVDEHHYATYVITIPAGGTTPDSAYYEYEIRTNEQGESYQYRFFRNRNGQTHEEIIGEACRLPVIVRRNGRELRFTYSNHCKLVERESDSLHYRAELDSTTQKALRIICTNKISGKQTVKHIFYNSEGNIERIAADGDTTILFYGAAAKPKKIITEKAELSYRYNTNEQPTHVEVRKKGILRIYYDAEGEPHKYICKKGQRRTEELKELHLLVQRQLRDARLHYAND